MIHIDCAKKTKEEILRELKTDLNGLPATEAKNRLEKNGYNELTTKKITSFDIFLRQIKSPMIYLLIAATIVSLGLREIKDAIIIFIILFINTILGFTQEFRSEKLLEKLKGYIVEKCTVRRNGKIEIIDRRNIVEGDIVLVDPGDIMPADLRIIKSHNLTVDESILTGESYPAQKNEAVQEEKIEETHKAKNLLFSGTTIVEGLGEGVVIATARKTLIGEIVGLTSKVKHKSLFEENISKVSKFILKTISYTLLTAFVINLIVKRGSIDTKELILFTIAMAISVIPEALPLITTLTLSSGALRMAKKHVIVKRLSAIHDLGSVDVLCTDKTGTITQNILSIKKIYTDNEENWLKMALLPSAYGENIRKKNILEPFDKAIYQQAAAKTREEIHQAKKIWHVPFDPALRRNAIVVEENNKYLLIVRGAPEEIIKKATQIIVKGEIKDFQDKETELKNISEAGLLGQRVLGVGYREVNKKEAYTLDDEKDFIYLGFAAFSDPLKPTAKEAVKQAQALGLAVKIITGDSHEVAEVVAREVGLPDTRKRVFTEAELEKMKPEEFYQAIDDGVVFARISPVMKYRIVEALEKKYSVAFLGEGFNDAPALKLTHVSMVVDSGADISKEAADIILLQKDLKVIVDGITEGRKVFHNVLKYIKYTLISNFGNFYGMVAISLVIPFLPMLAVQILLINLLSDLPLVAVVTDKVHIKEISKPQKYNFHELAFLCIFLGLISTLFDIIFFLFFNPLGQEMLRTLWFIGSILTELVIIYSIRTRLPFWKGGLPSWQVMIFGLVAAILTVLIPLSKFGAFFHFVPPQFSNIVLIFILVLVYFAMTEGAKLLYYRHKNNT